MSFQPRKERRYIGRYLVLIPFSTYFLRLSLAACLLLAGCPRGYLIDHGMVMESEVQQLPSRFVSIFLASLC